MIKNVPRQVAADQLKGSPIVVHGLLRHEHKQTVLHFAVQRNTEYTEPVRAKVSRLGGLHVLTARTRLYSVLAHGATTSAHSFLNTSVEEAGA